MKAGIRHVVLAVIVACGIALVETLYHAKIHPPLKTTFTSSLQVLGAPAKLVDRAASRLFPVGDLDERSLGDVYRRRYDPQVDPSDKDQAYCDQLLAELTPFTAKPFPYRTYVIENMGPNACALPGGVVLVTRGLFETLHSESELASVLAHELGHIECGHCFDAVRFKLLARKLDAQTLGSLADFAARLLVAHSYSKTMEHEADDYAFALLSASRLDPRGEGKAFQSLAFFLANSGIGTDPQANPIRDYFASHPPLEIRADEYGQRAEAWWRGHRGARRYVGRLNFEQRVAMTRREWGGEWVTDR